MAVPKRKTSKARRDKRRTSKERIDIKTYTECSNCHEMKLPHRVCGECGYYDGKNILDKE